MNIFICFTQIIKLNFDHSRIHKIPSGVCVCGGGGGRGGLGPDKDFSSHQHISWADERIQRGDRGPNHPSSEK